MICSSGRSKTSMSVSLEKRRTETGSGRETNRRSAKRNGVRPPFRFRPGLAGRQAQVSLRFCSKRNEMGVFEAVTRKARRQAPPYTVINRRDPFNFNRLRVSQNRPETVFLGKPVTICASINPSKQTRFSQPHDPHLTNLLASRSTSVTAYSVSPKSVSRA